MRTIVLRDEQVDKLWGKQAVHKDAIYRMMRYVFRVDHNSKVLLHNVVTGRLVVLDEAEAQAIEKLPNAYVPVLDQLVTEHYLVPEDYDECQQVLKLRSILGKLDDALPKTIEKYTILPTTACNARCYYCFEQGAKIATMTKQTADNVVTFIKTHSDMSRPVVISWFGGEPTLVTDRIDQICEGLQSEGVDYQSDMTTNGYLFDENMVNRAKNLWRMQSVMICFDGTEQNYNAIKAYIHPIDNPYERVMRNIGLLIDKQILVRLRMNFDVGNYQDFKDLVCEAKRRFGESPYLQVYVHPIVGKYKDQDGKVLHGSDEWFAEKICELNSISCSAGLFKREIQLPSLRYKRCQAANGRTLTITPEGNLVSCPEQFGEDQIKGNVLTGVTNEDIVRSWNEIVSMQNCESCCVFPNCIQMRNCSVSGSCCYLPELMLRFSETANYLMSRFEQ